MNATRDNAPPVGLIAGQGPLPVIVADSMRKAGKQVCCVGLSGQFAPELREHCDRFRSVGLLRPGQWIRTLRRWDVSEAVMIGRVSKRRMHDPFRLFRTIPDVRALTLWYRRLRHDKRTPALLAALADELGASGVTLIDSTTYIQDQMATAGPMTKARPTHEQEADIEFAWPILNEALRLQIGQAIAVRERDVIAVEAVEGTTRMIERAGQLCRRHGWTLLKSAPVDQDRRADVPTIGEQTIRAMKDAGGGCIALGVGDVIIADKEGTLRLADELGIAIVGLPRPT